MTALSFKADFLGTSEDTGSIDATRLDASTLPGATSGIDVLSLLAFDGDDDDAPVRIPATDVGSGGGGGGFTTEIPEPPGGVQIDIGGGVDGIHYRLEVATPLTLQPNATPGTRVAVSPPPSSAGTCTVTPMGGAVYRLPPTDGPSAAGRFSPFDLVDFTEFECIRNPSGIAEWDVWGVPAGAETQLAGPLDLNGQTIIPGAPVTVNTGVLRDYTAADSGKDFRVDVAATQRIPAGLPSGWRVTILNNTASSITIDGPGPNVTLASGEVCEVKYWSTTTIKVARGATVGIN